MNKQLGQLIFSFFEDYLKCQKGLRHTSILSYRDALCLYLGFVSNDTRHKLSQLKISDLTCQRVRQFLMYLEQERGNQIQTRNQRLAAIRTFFDYLATRDPLVLVESQCVTVIPIKRTPSPETYYLEHDEIDSLFTNLPIDTPLALRDHTLLLFLYNTGARAQEVSDLRKNHLLLGDEPRVRLHGKGDKWRTCPLWHKTAAMLEQLLEQPVQNSSLEEPVFLSRRGMALTRFGIYKIVRRHTIKLMKKRTDGSPLKISPHHFRHTTAVNLLESGVEVNVIRAWLGHVSLETTNRYAEISLRMKMKAMQTCEPDWDISVAHHQKYKWSEDKELLQWLKSL